MAREFRLLSVLWLVVACLAATTTIDVLVTSPEGGDTTITTEVTTTTQAPTTTPTVATTTTKGPTTTTTVATTTTKGPTTTATVATTTTKGPTTTATVATATAEGPTTTTAVATTTTKGPTTTTAVATTTTKGPTTTTAVATDVTTTTADQTNTTVDANTTTGPVGPSTTTPVPTTTPDPCDGKPCRDGSNCEPRVNQTFTCLCLAGEYNYESGICESAKVFPGKLDLPLFRFHERMTDKTSPEFKAGSQEINKELLRVYNGTDGYSGSIVLELRKLSKGSKVWSWTNGGSADVEIFFKANTDISSEDVKGVIKNATLCEDCLLASGTFDGTNLCDKNSCELTTTTCVPGSGSVSCNCLADYVKTNFSDRMCIACPSGKMAVGSETCIDCSFGQSGLNCNESWQLVLVIVGTVLGGLLLITLILLPILLRKSSKKSSKKNKKSDTEKSYNSHLPAKAPLVNNGLANGQAVSVNGPANSLSAFANAGVPRIPRATSTNSWDSRTNLEMAPSNGRQNLIPMGRNPRLHDDHDDMNPYAQARPQSSLYAQARPQNNPYAQNRPQTNPYAQSQGHSNPHYVHDDGRRFN